MKSIAKAIIFGFMLSGPLLVAGCGKGRVPDSAAEEIESAKFDAKKASEDRSRRGAASAPI